MLINSVKTILKQFFSIIDIDKRCVLAIQSHFGLSDYQLLLLIWLKGLWTGILLSLIAHYFISH